MHHGTLAFLTVLGVLARPPAAQRDPRWSALPPLPFGPRPVQAFAPGEQAVVLATPWSRDPGSYAVAVLGPERRWRTIDAPPLSARQQLLVRAVGGRLVVFGGRDPKTDRWCNDGAVLDPRGGTWTPMAPCPVGGRQCMAVADDGARLAFAAGTAGAHPVLDGAVYDVAADRWRRLPELPVAPRAFGLLAFAGEDLVLWGGWRPEGAGRIAPLADGAVIAPGDAAWRPLAPAPAAFGSNPGTIAAGGDAVLVFARTSGWLANGALLDLDSGSWTALPARDDFGVSPGVCHADGGHLFVYSGRLSGMAAPAQDAWSWHRNGGDWKPVRLPLGLAPRETPGLATSGPLLAVLGGARRTGLGVADGVTPPQPDLGNCYGDGFVVDVATGILQYVSEGPLGPVEQPAIAFWRGQLLVVGGHREEREWSGAAATFALAR